MTNQNQRSISDDFSDIPTNELMAKLPNYFKFNNNIKGTAYLNWRFDSISDIENQFFSMAKGYFETSIELIDNCIKDNILNKADIWIFPIMFNVVHGIEVYLKGFNSKYRIYTKLQEGEYQKSQIEGKHNIRQLCQVAVKLLRDNRDKELLAEFEFVQKFIDILYENTDDMTFARYPITAKGDNHFYVDEKNNITIDLCVFRQWTLRVFRILDSCTDMIEIQMDQINEWQSEMRSYYGEF